MCLQAGYANAAYCCESVDREGLDEHIDFDALDSGCCGMADSFGDEKEYYSMSKAIERILSDQIAATEGSQVVAPGASCRSQLAEMDDTGQFDRETPPHPVELLAAALPETT